MNETLLSPGTSLRENDTSLIQSAPAEYGAAIIGPTSKGPVEIPTKVTSFSEYTAYFGSTVESGSNVYSYLTSIAVNNYFQNGGSSILVTRVTSGTFSPAVSQDLENISGSVPFELETISEGEIMNNSGSETGNGSLLSGSSDNIRWEVSDSDSSTGTFNLLIRRGNDNNNQKVILESYNNLSLDPYESNFITKVIGDLDKNIITNGAGETYIKEEGAYPNISRYVRVKQVNTPTPNYFDNSGNPKTEFTSSLPQIGSGSFSGAQGSNIPNTGTANFYQNINTTTQGLESSDYDKAIALLNNQDEFQFNTIIAPGLINEFHSSQITSLTNLATSRGDCLAVIDLAPYGSEVTQATQEASGFDSSYAASYWPWLQTIDPNTGQLVYIPASTMIPGVYAFNDSSSEPWFAPAGIARGGLGQVTRAERKLTSSQRDTLYTSNINPIATFPNSGVVVYGQKTLQKANTALDRVNVRRLLIELKEYIGQIANNLVFEPNSAATRNNFLSQVNPYLESIQQRQGLYAFRAIMDDTNNSPDVIDRNELIGQIQLQPTKTSEFVILDFGINPTGAEFGQ